MNYKEILNDYPKKFDINEVYNILDSLRKSKNLGADTLKEVLTNDLSKVKSPDHKAIRRLFDYIIPTTIAEKDIKHAIEVYGEDITPEEFKSKVLDESTNDVDSIAKYKNGLMNGTGEIFGLYDVRPDGKRIIHLASNELFPHNPEMQEIGEFEHEIDVNASADNYAEVITQLFQSFVNDNLPFYMVVNLPNDLKYGICDPIRIFSSTKNLPNVIYEVNRMTNVVGDKLIAPSMMTENINNMYGYTSLVDKTRKSPMVMILDVIEKEIYQTIRDFNEYHPNEIEENEETWKSIVVELNYISDNYPEIYNQMVNNMMNYIEELGLNLDNLYVLPKITEDIKTIEEEKAKEELANKPISEEELNKNIEMINSLIGKIDDEVDVLEQQPTEEVKTEEKNEQSFALPEEIVTTPVEETPVEPIVEPIVTPEVTTLAPVIEQPFVNAFETKVEEAPVEPITTPIEEVPYIPIESIVSPVVEETPKVEEVVTPEEPVVEQIMQTTEENISNDVANIVADNQVVDEALDEEPVSFNTGAYSTVPVEVQSLDSNEIKSVIEEPQQGAVLSMQQTAEALGEYSQVLTAEEALEPIINANGENSTIIEVMKNDNVISKIPYDSVVTTSDSTTMTGIEFIKNVVIPAYRLGTPQAPYTIEKIIDRYSKNIQSKEEAENKKEGFFTKLFKKR